MQLHYYNKIERLIGKEIVLQLRGINGNESRCNEIRLWHNIKEQHDFKEIKRITDEIKL